MKRYSSHPRASRLRAFMLLDLMIALGMATALILMLALSVGALHRGERRLAESRAANRHLEEAMLKLQTGGTLDPDVTMERLGNGPANRAWVRLSLRSGTYAGGPQTGVEAGSAAGRSGAPGEGATRAALVGLVPADAAGGGL